MKITTTPWEIDKEANHSLHISSSNHHFANVIATCYSDPLDEDTKANAAAIVSAVNNTYGKGINPEAVSDIVRLAKDICRELSGYTMTENWGLRLELLQALDKAKL